MNAAMNVLVTGGAGYIGSVVAELLLQEGHAVVVVDNLSKGHADAVPPSARFIEGDLRDQALMKNALRDHSIDSVVHLAASSLVGESMTDPAKYYDNNVVAGLSLLDAMRKSGVQIFVFSSTAAVYGDPDVPIITEEQPTRPTNAYGETKLAFERALEWHRRAYGLRCVSLRYFNAAGATADRGERHDPETHLIPNVLNAASANRAVTIFGDDHATADGTCVRDYIHIVDLARAHIVALAALSEGPLPRAAYNLGNGDGHSVRQVIESARRVTGIDIKARVGPRRAGDPPRLVASSEAIKRDLGWAPSFPDLDEIIRSAWRFLVHAQFEARSQRSADGGGA